MDAGTIRTRLNDRLADLDARIRRIEAERRAPLDADSEEQAVALEGEEALAGIERSAIDEAGQLRLALQRLDAGTYGLCARCDQPIAPARLEAMPAATRCVGCEA